MCSARFSTGRSLVQLDKIVDILILCDCSAQLHSFNSSTCHVCSVFKCDGGVRPAHECEKSTGIYCTSVSTQKYTRRMDTFCRIAKNTWMIRPIQSKVTRRWRWSTRPVAAVAAENDYETGLVSPPPATRRAITG
jgi:hypothetical protein